MLFCCRLSQLQTVNHSKDKVIKEEREQRIRQMERIQQDVAKMPQDAVYQLVGPNISNIFCAFSFNLKAKNFSLFYYLQQIKASHPPQHF